MVSLVEKVYDKYSASLVVEDRGEGFAVGLIPCKLALPSSIPLMIAMLVVIPGEEY